MKPTKIILTQGFVAVVDEKNHFWLSMHPWYYHHGYAVRNDNSTKPHKTIYMHRVILERKLGHSDFEEGDHTDQDKLNDCENNLRPATKAQNMQNSRKQANTTSKYKGVTWHIGAEKWMARIHVDGKQIHLGLFDDEIEAAKAYDVAAVKHFGEFVVLNFPEDDK